MRKGNKLQTKKTYKKLLKMQKFNWLFLIRTFPRFNSLLFIHISVATFRNSNSLYHNHELFLVAL